MIDLQKIAHQKDYEKLVFLLRRHWIVIAGHFCMFILEAGLPFVLVFFLPIFSVLLSHTIFGPLLILVGSAYYLTITLLFFHHFIDYYLDVWIVTNERLINIEQHGLFSRVIGEIRYYRIQDVASEVKGILPTLFHYGDVTVQTAGTQPRFTMKQVSGAHTVARRIHELLEADKQYHTEKKKVEGIT